MNMELHLFTYLPDAGQVMYLYFVKYSVWLSVMRILKLVKKEVSSRMLEFHSRAMQARARSSTKICHASNSKHFLLCLFFLLLILRLTLVARFISQARKSHTSTF